MPLLEQPPRFDETDQGFATPLGLFRRERLPSGPAGTITNLFTNLRQVSRGEIIAEHPERHLQGTRLAIERSDGQGSWEFYRLDQDLYLVAANGIYEAARVETVPGEGLVEFHLRLNGSLQMHLPHDGSVVHLRSPGLLILYQPPGVDLKVRVDSKVRETGVSLYCHPRWLHELARRSGIDRWQLLEEIEQHPKDGPWYRQLELSPALQYIANSLLSNHHRSGIRLLHAEAKSLELLCELLSGAQAQVYPQTELVTAGEARQLDAARRMLASNLQTPARVRDVARAVGMSESKLRRLFKAHVGVTVSDFALECRMRCALDLLRGKQVSVGQAARAVGYRHQTSFASAFQDFFGFQPRKARQDMH